MNSEWLLGETKGNGNPKWWTCNVDVCTCWRLYCELMHMELCEVWLYEFNNNNDNDNNSNNNSNNNNNDAISCSDHKHGSRSNIIVFICRLWYTNKVFFWCNSPLQKEYPTIVYIRTPTIKLPLYRMVLRYCIRASESAYFMLMTPSINGLVTNCQSILCFLINHHRPS